MRAIAYLLVVIVVATLGYGFWYAHTHAYLVMDIRDEQNKHVLNAQLSFGHKTGQMLAEGKTDSEDGIVLLRHPGSGYCEPYSEERRVQWSECLEEHAVWQAKWLPRVSTVNIRIGSCEVVHVPVTFKTHAVWGFWWLPMPHMGGLESTMYEASLKMNRSRCATT